VRLHLDGIARREGMRREPRFQLIGSDSPADRKTVKLKVLEPHGSALQKAKRAILTEHGIDARFSWP
jgi:hypothetical protein